MSHTSSQIVLLLLIQGSCALELRGMEVPPFTELFLPVRLGCRFRLGTSRLHSVKWYKDDEEFYRFTPNEKPQTRQFNLPGAQVEMNGSDMHIVTLKVVTRLSAGEYRCEVSSDGPEFQTVQRSTRMDVYALPDREPEIQLNRSEILSGDEIVAICSSGKSYPLQKLTWHLNGLKVNSTCIVEEKATVTGNGLFRSYSKVRLKTTGGPGPILLTCIGEAPSLYSHRAHADISLKGEPTNQRFTQSSSPSDHRRSELNFGICTLKLILIIIAFACLYASVLFEDTPF